MLLWTCLDVEKALRKRETHQSARHYANPSPEPCNRTKPQRRGARALEWGLDYEAFFAFRLAAQYFLIRSETAFRWAVEMGRRFFAGAFCALFCAVFFVFEPGGLPHRLGTTPPRASIARLNLSRS